MSKPEDIADHAAYPYCREGKTCAFMLTNDVVHEEPG